MPIMSVRTSMRTTNLFAKNMTKFSWILVAIIYGVGIPIVFLSKDEVSTPLEQPESPSLTLTEEVVPEVFLYGEREIECLALNSYFEARNQSVAGQIAVAQVVLNRVNSPKFPNTICEVIQQGPTYENWKGTVLPIRNQCHFSWWCDGMSDIPHDQETYDRILKLVTKILEEKTVDITDGSVYYHADYVKPYWINTLHKTLVVDDHVFYKENNQ